MVHTWRSSVDVDERESRTRHFLFASRSKTRDDSLGQRSFSAPKVPRQQNYNRWSQPLRKFPSPFGRFFRGICDDLFSHRAESPAAISPGRPEFRSQPLPQESLTAPFPTPARLKKLRVNTLPVRARVASRQFRTAP